MAASQMAELCSGYTCKVTGYQLELPYISAPRTSLEGPIAFRLVARRTKMPSNIEANILDFAYTLHMDLGRNPPSPSIQIRVGNPEHDIIVSREKEGWYSEGFVQALETAFEYLWKRGSPQLLAGLHFVVSGANTDEFSDDDNEWFEDDANEPRRYTTRLSTFAGYFKIEDRCRSLAFGLGGSEFEFGFDYWCTAHSTRIGSDEDGFNARVWLVVKRRFAEGPQAFWNVPPSCRDFQIRWRPGHDLTLRLLDRQSILSTCFSMEVDLDNACFMSSGGKLTLPQVDASCSAAQEAQWTAEFSMLAENASGVSLGDHYTRQVNKVERSCNEEPIPEHAEPVIQEVLHDDLVLEAAVDPLEGSAVEHELWATGIEHRISSESVFPARPADEQYLLLKFSRYTKELNSAILASHMARRLSDSGMSVEPGWAKGAKILAPGLGPSDLDDVTELRAWHVVIREEQEVELMDALKHLPYNIRKLKAGDGHTKVPGAMSLCNVSAIHEPNDDTGVAHVIEYEVVRTFIHVGPRLEQLDTRTVHTV